MLNAICLFGCLVALARYEEIVDAEDSFELDFDSLSPGKTKPSKAAIRVNDLLENITGKLDSTCCELQLTLYR